MEIDHHQWKGMDGATAWHIIDRHAENWQEVGKMMNAWLKANQTQGEEDASRDQNT